MIGWYVHHHGHGHLTRATAVRALMSEPVVVLSSLPEPEWHDFAGWVQLARDDEGPVHEPSAGGRLHWAPLGSEGLARRNATVTAWIATHRPRLIVVDVSVEMTLLARLCGVPVIVVAGPGERNDAPHQLAYDVAQQIVAAWPRHVYDPAFLHRHRDKTSYVGAFSRYDGLPPSTGPGSGVFVLNGSGGTDVTAGRVRQAQRAVPDLCWTSVGGPGQTWSADVWSQLSRAAVVVTHAGQNALAEVAAAARPSVVVAQERPFGEQRAVSAALQASGIAVGLTAWPGELEWPSVIDAALALGGSGWSRWSSGAGAARAATVIESSADVAAVSR